MLLLRPLLLLALCAAASVQAQTGRLNDTGQTGCYNASNVAVACDAATTGNAGTRPHQDGRYGRDAAQAAGVLPAKTGGGAAGFDFTRLCWNGAAEGTAQCTGTLVANTGSMASTTATTAWACTRDNVTGLVWSLQTQSANWNAATAAGYADPGHNTANRCGYSTGWRLPNRRELLSIVHGGLSTGPVVDAAYFPSTPSAFHFSADPVANDSSSAWTVDFNVGRTGTTTKTTSAHLRLVRNVGTPVVDTTAPTKAGESLNQLTIPDNAGTGTMTFSETVTLVSYRLITVNNTGSVLTAASASGNVVSFSFNTSDSDDLSIEVVVRDAAGNEATLVSNAYNIF